MNMKKIFYMIFLFSIVLPAVQGCQETEQPEGEKTSDILLEVRASCLDFIEMGQTVEPSVSPFEAGDTIGVYGIDTDGSVLSGCRNVPFVYDGVSDWEGKVYYYDGAVYFAYFPYRKSVSSLKTLSDIEDVFVKDVRTTVDQSTSDYLRSCDFMTAENIVPADGVLDFTLSRRMSMVEITFPDIEYKESADAEPYYTASVGSLEFEVNDVDVKPCMTSQGVYRYILVPENNFIYGEYKVAGDWADYGAELVFEPGSFKKITVVPDETEVIHTLAVGDFFLKSGALLPKDAALTVAEREECIGVVFWTGDPTASDPVLKKDFPGCTHGLVVSLEEFESQWCSETDVRVDTRIQANAQGFTSINTKLDPDDKTDNPAMNTVIGYNNTMAIDLYNTDGLAEQSDMVTAVEEMMKYRNANHLDIGTSGWYLPSIKELALLYMGEGSIWSSKDNVAQEINKSIEQIIGHIDGAALLTGDYWSSTEAGTGSAHRIEASGKVTGTRMFNKYRIRPVMAF